MIKCRPAISMILFSEAMNQVFKIETVDDLIAYCEERYKEIINIKDLTINYHGEDKRNNWTTYLICNNGDALFFSDGIVEGITVRS